MASLDDMPTGWDGRVVMAAASRNAMVHLSMGTIARSLGEPMAGSGRQQAALGAMASGYPGP